MAALPVSMEGLTSSACLATATPEQVAALEREQQHEGYMSYHMSLCNVGVDYMGGICFIGECQIESCTPLGETGRASVALLEAKPQHRARRPPSPYLRRPRRVQAGVAQAGQRRSRFGGLVLAEHDLARHHEQLCREVSCDVRDDECKEVYAQFGKGEEPGMHKASPILSNTAEFMRGPTSKRRARQTQGAGGPRQRRPDRRSRQKAGEHCGRVALVFAMLENPPQVRNGGCVLRRLGRRSPRASNQRFGRQKVKE
mmetsp:Transcript_26180/g.84521  ORF Transcript_26180/g.84521 Transcript_26180/m.84521 type:complete len:256 (+) Transcript_26180:38-805(+)